MSKETEAGCGAVGAPVEPSVRPAAWIDASGQPHPLSYVQGVAERRLYGPLQPLYDEQTLWNACARAAEVEKQRAAAQIASLRDLADSEGARAVEYLRRARKAEAAQPDDEWDRAAERITREALGDDVTRPINPHATCIDDL